MSVPAPPAWLGPGFAADDEALRLGVAAVPAPREVVELAGPDAAAYLQGQCSQDVADLAPGGSAWALLLSPRGKLEALVRVTRRDDASFLLDVDGGFGAAVVERLLRFRLRVKVECRLLDWAPLCLRGPEAAEAAGRADGVAMAVPFAWGPLRGVDLLGPAPAAHVRAAGSAAWAGLRIEAGFPVMGAELDERTIPAEAGLVEPAVSFTKGCYTGQELVARLDARGSRVARHLRGLVGPAGSEAAFGAGAGVTADGRPVGAVTSSGWSSRLQAAVALAYVARAVEPGSQVEVEGAAGAGALGARVAELPLAG